MSQRYTHSPWDPPPLRPVRPRGQSDPWALAKQIDELGGEWTFSDFIERASNFHHSVQRIRFYEHTGGWNDLTRDVFLNQRAREFGLMLGEAGTVGLTFQVFPSIFNPANGEVPMPGPGEVSIGEHSARVVAVSTTHLVIQHGWSGWTPSHTALLSREYFDASATGGIVSRSWNRGPSEATTHALYEAKSAAEFRRLWATHGRVRQVRVSHDGTRLRLDVHPTWSLQACQDAAVVSLTMAPDIRVGVAVLVLAEENAQIGDLFIWPPYRRRGLGSLLESLVVAEAARAGCTAAQLYLWKGDSIRGMDRAHSFMTSRGYAIEASDALDCSSVGFQAIV